jgi:spore maturation protein CgeB
LKIVILGLSITSSWGNGHATTYRALVRALAARKHQVLFLERDVPWYACHRDLPQPPYGETRLYRGLEELKEGHRKEVRDADLVMVGSYVPEGIAVGEWVIRTARGLTAFYDIDTPVTLARLADRSAEYLTPAQVAQYDLYLSFTGGPTLERLERELGARCARPLYCSFDPSHYYPEANALRWELGYLGTYSACRQPALERLMLAPARKMPRARMVVAGPQYPASIRWPRNVDRIEHLAPPDHRRFYTSQRFTFNATRASMVGTGYSPSVRLFEAAACGTPIISDRWPGLETFFRPGEEILITDSPADTLRFLRTVPADEARRIGQRARARVLAEHTAAHRVQQLERYLAELELRRGARRRATSA